MVTKEEFREATAVLKYLTGKTTLVPQEVWDFQCQVNTCLLYRIQRLEEDVARLEKIAWGGKEQPPASSMPE